ncbi:DUF4114 domain-containing protein [Flavobacterium sp. RHBU_3]|uniref:DUF4114 domain-containing protein n=1 Tax=Flavobacterium sp. RHBU_3 TaxID=3391184 RepID=UPI0039853655
MKRLLLLASLMYGVVTYAQGYQFLSTYDSNGVPTVIEGTDVISSATLSLIQSAVPEGYPVPTYNPQYISSGYDTNIELLEDADVYVTFVDEGAGYRNVLGFYTYSITNPPTSPPLNSDIHIIFPNASLPNSGGNLARGTKVKIGSFSAGTGIGWILISNGWNGSSVGAGYWKFYSNQEWNPETNPDIRQHNVLINDPDNQRIILGFEDIKRDNSGCDQDFNDAMFYITANPYNAMRTANVADISEAADISSGNDGGLESNGSLANLIARRNFKRIKTNSFLNKKSLQSHYTPTASYLKSVDNLTIENLFPDTGMFGNEVPYVSSPQDLIGITNAEEVFAVDYYSGDTRVAAALATRTTGSVYNHSKMICDRLNGSSLEDVRTVTIQGHKIIMVKLKRANGITEYALTFSVADNASSYLLHSYWNIAQYPEANYLNFQVWGTNMGQVSAIVNHIIDEFNTDAPLTSDEIENRIPTVFVKKGSYHNGELSLEMINKSASSTLTFQGNKKATEVSETEVINTTSNLTGDYNESLTLTTGGLFDIGFSITANNSAREDGLYLADGPWGVDYNTEDTTIENFTITPYEGQSTSGTYDIERDAALTGQVKGTVNLFRNILAGELTFDATPYEAINFNLASSHAVEVVMVTEGLTDWNNRLRYQIEAQPAASAKSIQLSSFANPQGETYNGQPIKGFVFSVIGNYSTFVPFNISVSNASLGTYSLGINDATATAKNTFYNYPNPFNGSTTVVLPVSVDKANVQIVDLTGRIVYNDTLNTQNGTSISLNNLSLNTGTYIIRAMANGKQYQSKCIVK